MCKDDGSGKFGHKLHLPVAPADLPGPVKAWRQEVEIDTYSPERPERNPMFLEKRVYQGSSGRGCARAPASRFSVKAAA